MNRLFKHISDFLNRHQLTKTLFSNANSKYIYVGLEGSQSMSDISINELEYEPQYVNTEQIVGLSSLGLMFSPFEDLPRSESFTGGKYELIKLEPNFVKPEIKPEITPPVYVEGESIRVSSQQLEISKPYYVRLENRRYVIFMPAKGVIDLYALPG